MAFRKLVLLASVAPLLVACAVGPDYLRPKAAVTPAFKEAPQPALPWKQAQPKDDVNRGEWWRVFGDAGLDAFEAQIAISNQNVKASEAAFRQARALVAEARSGFFPSLGANVSQSRSGSGGGQSSTPGISRSAGTFTSYSATLDAGWELDLWGRLRRTQESADATAQATAADLAAANLSAQSELAIDYIDFRLADEQKRLLETTVANYQRALQLTQNQYKVGVAARGDVIQAQAQLEAVQAQLIDVGVQRAQFEHAIAILVGKAPAELTLEASQFVPLLPAIPSGVPSELLERRPDIAAAERRVAAANAQIGVAKAAFFPDLTLSASGGYTSASFAQWFTMPNRMWSIGPTLIETLFDAGLRSAQTEAAIAAYDQTVANYRQTVLAGFQEVEDNFAAMRILEQEASVEDRAVQDAHIAVTIAINQYKAGIVNYLNVLTAQTTELNTQLTALTIRKARLTAAATLIKALGGGWDAAKLDKPEVTSPQTTPFSILPPATPPFPH